MMIDGSPEDANTRYVNDSPQQIACVSPWNARNLWGVAPGCLLATHGWSCAYIFQRKP